MGFLETSTPQIRANVACQTIMQKAYPATDIQEARISGLIEPMGSGQLLNLPRFGIHEKVILQAREIDRLLRACL